MDILNKNYVIKQIEMVIMYTECPMKNYLNIYLRGFHQKEQRHQGIMEEIEERNFQNFPRL